MTTLANTKSHLNDGEVSFQIGLKGEPLLVEEQRIQYVLDMVNRHTRCPVHFQCVTSFRGLELINQCKHTHSHHVSVGASASHFVVSDDACMSYNTRFKCNPPFRSRDQVIALQRGLSNGWVDHLTALHVPVSGDQYAHSFFDASFGQSTIDHYLDVASSVFIDSGLDGRQLSGLLQLPAALPVFDATSTIDLKQMANFSILRSTPHSSQSIQLFGCLDFDGAGGLVASSKRGTLYT